MFGARRSMPVRIGGQATAKGGRRKHHTAAFKAAMVKKVHGSVGAKKARTASFVKSYKAKQGAKAKARSESANRGVATRAAKAAPKASPKEQGVKASPKAATRAKPVAIKATTRDMTAKAGVSRSIGGPAAAGRGRTARNIVNARKNTAGDTGKLQRIRRGYFGLGG